MIFQKKTESSECFERRPEIPWKALEDRVVILDRLEGELLHLNDLGARIWQELSPGKRLRDLASLLQEDFEAPLEVMEKDICRFVAQLEKMELVRKCGPYDRKRNF